MSGLIWVQTVCKSYQQTALGDKELTLSLLANCHLLVILSISLSMHVMESLIIGTLSYFQSIRFPKMWYVRPANLRSACAYAQSDQSFCWSHEYSIIVKLLTEHHFDFLSLKGGYRGSSESTLVKMSNCWKSHALAHIISGVKLAVHLLRHLVKQQTMSLLAEILIVLKYKQVGVYSGI